MVVTTIRPYSSGDTGSYDPNKSPLLGTELFTLRYESENTELKLRSGSGSGG